jgi:hypothetical protein
MRAHACCRTGSYSLDINCRTKRGVDSLSSFFFAHSSADGDDALLLTFPAILRPAQTPPSHPEFPNVRHFPHSRCTPYASRKGSRTSLQRAAEVYHASCPRSSTDRSCYAANGHASIPHLVLLAPFHLSKQLGLAHTFAERQPVPTDAATQLEHRLLLTHVISLISCLKL